MNTRRVAAKILTATLKHGQSLTVALENSANDIDSAQDKAFIQALCYGTLRHFYALDFILNSLLKKPIKDEEVKALILTGLYQLKFMRVKPHAAVSETVSALSKKKQHAKALVNAILRNYLREQEALEAAAAQNQSAATAHPAWLIRQIQSNWPAQSPAIFEQNNQQAPMVLRVNQRKCTPVDYLKKLQDIDIKAKTVNFCSSAVVLEKAVVVEKLPGFNEGLVSVQDSAAQLAAGLLDVRAGDRVLDVCAAPGGKTAHILEAQPELAYMLAVDIDKQRLERVNANMQRLHLLANVVSGDATKPADWWDGKLFDRVLVDAPCSATGVIRRHPDIKLLRREADIKQLQIMQKEILTAIWPLLAPEGILLYASCSILKQENEQQIHAFLESQADAAEIAVEAEWGIQQRHGRQILPGDNGMDGFYYAKLQKH